MYTLLGLDYLIVFLRLWQDPDTAILKTIHLVSLQTVSCMLGLIC